MENAVGENKIASFYCTAGRGTETFAADELNGYSFVEEVNMMSMLSITNRCLRLLDGR